MYDDFSGPLVVLNPRIKYHYKGRISHIVNVVKVTVQLKIEVEVEFKITSSSAVWILRLWLVRLV